MPISLLDDVLFSFFLVATFLFLVGVGVLFCVGLFNLMMYLFWRALAWVLYQVCLGPVIGVVIGSLFCGFSFFVNYSFRERWPEAYSCYYFILSCLNLNQQSHLGMLLAVMIYILFISCWCYWVVYDRLCWVTRLVRRVAVFYRQAKDKESAYKWQ